MNWLTDGQAERIIITTGLQLGGMEVLSGFRSALSKDRADHPITDRLKETGVWEGSGGGSSLTGWEPSMLYQINIDSVSKSNLELGWATCAGIETRI